MAWSEAQQVALAIVPKFSSTFSLLGSLWISIEVLTDTKSDIPKRRHPYHRLLLGMSIYDILESAWNFLSTWPIPKGTEGVWDARGTTHTCTAQGFFLTLSVAVPIYNAFLSLYYLLVIKYNISDITLRQRVEPAMHAFAFFWAFGTALVSAWMGLINNANLWCWIAPFPSGCKDSRRYGEEGNCERGDNAWIYRWAFYFAPLWLCILFATVCTIMVYVKVYHYDQISLKYRKPERVSFLGVRLSEGPNRPSRSSFQTRRSTTSSITRNVVAAGRIFQNKDDDFDSDGSLEDLSRTFRIEGLAQIDEEDNGNVDPDELQDTSTPSSRSRLSDTKSAVSQSLREWVKKRQSFAKDNPRTTEVFRQALWYLLTFYITHVWSTTNRAIQQSNNGKTYFGVILVHSFFDPLQGFLNFLVYQRPRYIRARKESPDCSRWQTICSVLRFSYLPPPPVSNIESTISLRDSRGPSASHDPAADAASELLVSKESKNSRRALMLEEMERSAAALLEELKNEDDESEDELWDVHNVGADLEHEGQMGDDHVVPDSETTLQKDEELCREAPSAASEDDEECPVPLFSESSDSGREICPSDGDQKVGEGDDNRLESTPIPNNGTLVSADEERRENGSDSGHVADTSFVGGGARVSAEERLEDDSDSGHITGTLSESNEASLENDDEMVQHAIETTSLEEHTIVFSSSDEKDPVELEEELSVIPGRLPDDNARLFGGNLSAEDLMKQIDVHADDQ